MANMRAKVELLGSESHTGRGRTIERGKPLILTNPSDIRYYQAQGGFSVTMLDQPLPGGKGKPVPKPAKGKAAPPPEDDEELDEDDSEESDDSEDTEESSEDTEESEDDSEEGEEQEATDVMSKADLEKLTKPALVELAKDNFGLELNVNDAKGKLVQTILKEQIARANNS